MTSDDQHFLDVLAGISNDIKKFSADVADATDRHFESVAGSIKESLATTSWLPRSIKPPPPPRALAKPPMGYLERAQDWVSRNRAVTAAIIAFLGTGTFLIYNQKKEYMRKRRARRASNGARREVIVIAGPPSSPITKSLSLDLERRGFIVYVVVNTPEEEQIVQSESRVDIRPLLLDIADSFNAQQAMERFHKLLLSPHQAFAGASAHNLNFTGLVLVPDLIYPSGPVETIPPEYWSDALNAKVLNTIATTQAFLPTICEFKSRILLLTPSIVSALRPPFHGVESAVVGALEGFTSSLKGELSTIGIDVCHIKLGTFDCSGVGNKQYLQSLRDRRTDEWPAAARALYAENYVTQARIAGSRGLFADNGSTAKGSSLRELHNAVFDALTRRQAQKVWRVGRGSVAYDIVGSWVPAGMVRWMLGIRAGGRVTAAGAEPQLGDSVQWEKVQG
ncbi:uncharacterized protein K452DRAFT_282870 [Aplosporella prunicola CBS 121167]|uniref:DUF1776-domain-containing protein n=1 Tax=Aplosporella prunicola CBS 121167 TaxID=1176127 RepID=A0A6A6BSB4_9PEZI|nr:uncharacterized protein K452DRAFT_282870 [Aplosporella prunicola CBS 121167]KAF2146688.1 hypothetical protein K452DRAFT_282870 [Aplosporella prunicola CBS 121167]